MIETLRDVLKVGAADLRARLRVVRAGAARVSMVGCNVNVANTVAAIFTATGQDIACVHESSVGTLDVFAASQRRAWRTPVPARTRDRHRRRRYTSAGAARTAGDDGLHG